MFETGITACDQLKEVHFSGNIIPQIWYEKIVKKDLKHPKPHLLAINILSDIVYWYRPTEVRDESTGQLVGYKKKFSSDLLQRNYNQIAEMFGCSYGQAKEAIVFLESMGILKRIFRDIEVNGVVFNNVLFIDLKVDRLKELTYPDEEENSAEVGGNFTGGEPKIPQRGVAISSQGAAEFHRTNTEISSEISSQITPSIHRQETAESEPVLVSENSSDGLGDRKLKSIVEEEMEVDGFIPYTYKNDQQKMEFALKYLIG